MLEPLLEDIKADASLRIDVVLLETKYVGDLQDYFKANLEPSLSSASRSNSMISVVEGDGVVEADHITRQTTVVSCERTRNEMCSSVNYVHMNE